MHNTCDQQQETTSNGEAGSILRTTPHTPSSTTYVYGQCTQDMSGTSPLHFFELFFDNTILEEICAQTNLYADQYIATAVLGPHSRAHGWKKLGHDANELKRFLAICIVMGLVHLPTIEAYWCISWPYASSNVSKVMSNVMISKVLQNILVFLDEHRSEGLQYLRLIHC